MARPARASATDSYILTVPVGTRQRLASGWLWLGLTALIGSGLFSVLLVLSRTPQLQPLFPAVDFFRTALVVHVDLSVLVWFLAFAGILWSVNSTDRWVRVGWTALGLAAVGTAAIALAPFLGRSQPLLSNYVPVLQHPVFYAGLLSFALGMALLVWRTMTAVPRVGFSITAAAALRFGLNTTAVSAAMALIAFLASYLLIPGFISGKSYYELLFWGGGHMLQFTYTLLMLVAWLWLASASGVRLPLLSPRVVAFLFALGLVTVFSMPIVYFSFEITSHQHKTVFTWLMQYGGSLATLPLALAVLQGLILSDRPSATQRPLRTALLTSMALFGSGGVIGFLIGGSDVTIPAHYHGCFVGVTLALMGMTYDLLPRLGYGQPSRGLAHAQLCVYTGGQWLHVLGLVWSGGYGVQRKVAGAAQGLDRLQELAAMGLMGLGGLIAITGGLLFLLVVLHAVMRPRRNINTAVASVAPLTPTSAD